MDDPSDTYLLHQRLGWRVSRLARIMQSRLEEVLARDNLTRLMWVVLCGLEGASTYRKTVSKPALLVTP